MGRDGPIRVDLSQSRSTGVNQSKLGKFWAKLGAIRSILGYNCAKLGATVTNWANQRKLSLIETNLGQFVTTGANRGQQGPNVTRYDHYDL